MKLDAWKTRSPDDELDRITEPPRELPPIVTSYIHPPIPVRTCDWCAYREGMEEMGGYGYGRTEEEAIADLLANEEEE